MPRLDEESILSCELPFEFWHKRVHNDGLESPLRLGTRRIVDE